ncbi:MAG: 23S rRNA (uracil(1939)-C(5))-methyltransferase RlmD [Lachnospiraceae bacterium]|nr:23S rRNA (uracil(1939)-C(5))-methyltransferase RlmD [Lachnospiraceae bacterium]
MGKTYRVGCKKLNNEGKGEFVFNNSKFAVKNFLPGEKGQIELIHVKDETYAKLVSIDTFSKDRIKPDCPVFEHCGGCQLRHVSYEKSLEIKDDMMKELYGDLYKGHIIGMDNPDNYRDKCFASFKNESEIGHSKRNDNFGNQKKDRGYIAKKLEDRYYSGKNGIISGLYEENSHRVIKVSKCLSENKLANDIIEYVTKVANELRIPAYNEDRNDGVLRHIYVRIGHYTNEAMVVIVVGTNDFRDKIKLSKAITEKFKEVKTVFINYNDRKTSAVLSEKYELLYGEGYITDKIDDLTFRLSPSSFYQVNPVQAKKLYSEAVEMAGLKKDDVVLDAYCGIGTISLLEAKKAKEVYGVEVNKKAIEDAKINARINKIENVTFVAEDAGEYMKKCSADNKKMNVVVLDPPREGCEKAFIDAMMKMEPERIVYISCNPVTQKRDIDIMKKCGYEIKEIKAVDMFPFSSHVETVVLLSKKHVNPKAYVEIGVDAEEYYKIKGEKL